VKLLSPKPFAEYDADEYHAYIKSLNKPKDLTSSRKEQHELKVRVKRKKDGTLSVVTKRNPLYVTEKEIEKISAETSIAQSELFIVLRDRGFSIHRDHREARRIAREISEIPF
jgi:hypothetical protein